MSRLPTLTAQTGLTVIALALALPAAAQDADTFDISASSMDGQGTLQRLHPHLDDQGSYYFGAGFVYAMNPLVGIKDGEAIPLVTTQFATRVMGGYNINGHARIDLDVPVYPVLTSAPVDDQGEVGALSTGFAMGDIRLSALVPIVDYDQNSDAGLAFGITPFVLLPTATEGVYVSNETFAGGLFASLGGKAGALNWTVDAGTAIGGSTSLGETATGSTVELGGGFSYAVAEPFRLGLELDQRVNLASSGLNGGNPTEVHGYGTYGNCEGFHFTFGAGTSAVKGVGSPPLRLLAALSYRGASCELPDTDGDGITDDVDQCPTKPEDMDGFQDTDGCPDDNDGDGIADKVDSCPSEPGPESTNGCPDKDADGLADNVDKCPSDPGPSELMGCPDRDADGFADYIDKCPDIAGGKGSKDGCPVVVVTKESIQILDRVFFETNKAVILIESHNLLDDVAAILQKHDNIKKVEIQGHTDDRGSDSYNMKLSQSRAESVREYLIKQGVDADRLVAKGLGESQPLEAAETEAARAKNRRVEFRILEQ